MDFEFDPEKSLANHAKHGIDFTTAQTLWSDPDLIEIAAKVLDEQRWLVIGKIGSKFWSAVVTRRADSIRLISVRRSRKEEIRLYEG